jgi:hypothetical protein
VVVVAAAQYTVARTTTLLPAGNVAARLVTVAVPPAAMFTAAVLYPQPAWSVFMTMP